MAKNTKITSKTTAAFSKAQLSEMARYLGIGFVMGAADVVPGVSGGTMAFIFGIYQRLLDSIKTVSGTALQLLFKGKIREAIAVVPFAFLVPLATGLLLAVLTLSSVLTYLLDAYPVYIWAFFFGLVVASIKVVSRRISVWSAKEFAGAALAAVAAYFIVGAVPTETAATPVAFFLSGVVAICAMILPGISGSFLLVVLGKYQQVLTAVTERDFMTLGIFMVGAVVGLALFARVLSWLFAHYENVTMAVLTGFMVGSLRKIWPWKETVLTMVDSHGEIVPVVQNNVLPAAFDMSVIIALLLCGVGIALVLFSERNSAKDTAQHS